MRSPRKLRPGFTPGCAAQPPPPSFPHAQQAPVALLAPRIAAPIGVPDSQVDLACPIPAVSLRCPFI
ncbi:hypothetical protein GEV39_06550 [Pseudomonas sp. NY5710]|nr:hypothetical protein GEV39_06550 [Pseudomonas sp. NY5710]